MEPPRDRQLDFDFATAATDGRNGLDSWRVARQHALEDLAFRQGLPLGRRVRVEFASGPPLEGLLRLSESILIMPDRKDARLHLRIGDSDFHADEIRACIRID